MKSEINIAASSVGEPWWLVGSVVARQLAALGYEPTVLTKSAVQENPRFVRDGKADIGVSTPATVGWAIRGEHAFKDETFPEFRAIARIRRPSWLVAAARYETGFTSLRDMADSNYPIRLLTSNLNPSSTAGVAPKQVVDYYGLTPEALTARGGSVHELYGQHAREGDFDLMISNFYLGYTYHSRYWYDAAILHRLRFLDLDDELLGQLEAAGHGKPGKLPYHIIRGVDRDVAALERNDGILIYVRADLDADFVYGLTAALYNAREEFLKSAVHMVYDPPEATNVTPLELHDGARRFYER